MEVEMGRVAAGLPGLDEYSRLGEVLHAAGRGAVDAMAMTGVRVLTTELGLVEQTPPQAVSRQRARGCAPCYGGRHASSAGGWSRSPTGPSALAAARRS